jgi:hypothetical protein
MDECEQYEANSSSKFQVTLANFTQIFQSFTQLNVKLWYYMILYEICGPLPNLKGADHFSNEAPLPK